MKTILNLAICCMLIGTACSNQKENNNSTAYNAAPEVTTTTDTAAYAGDGNTVPELNSPKRKIVRKAAIKCRVNDVFAATSSIERLISNYGGQIAESIISNEPSGRQSMPYTSDSLIAVQRYATTSKMTLRVAAQQLDTVLSAIAQNATFIDNRSLNLEDVTLKYLSNQLHVSSTTNTSVEQAKHLAKKSSEVIATERFDQERHEANIDRNIDNMAMREQTVYATLYIELYQPERVDQVIVANTDHLMKPPFFTSIFYALRGGWSLLQEFVLVVIGLWPLCISVLIATIIYRKFKARRRLAPRLS